MPACLLALSSAALQSRNAFGPRQTNGGTSSMIVRSAPAACVAAAPALSPLLKVSMNFWMGAISCGSGACAAAGATRNAHTTVARVRFRICNLLPPVQGGPMRDADGQFGVDVDLAATSGRMT